MAHLDVYLFGYPKVILDGQIISAFEYDKVLALLAYLVIQNDHPHYRQSIAGLLWPEYPERSARASLRNALATLRKVLKEDRTNNSFLQSEGETIQFNPKKEIWVDVNRFDSLLRKFSGNRISYLEEAVALYQGDFLGGFSLKDSAQFEEWALALREGLQIQAVNALEELVRIYEAQGELEMACQTIRRVLSLEPWCEEAHQQLIRLLALQGKRSLALKQFDYLRKTLKEELGAQPSSETLQLYEKIRDGKHTTLAQLKNVSILYSEHEKYRHNLPAKLKSFIGRQAEIMYIKYLLAHHHLVTITGAGGSGKSYLALQTAREMVDLYPDGVWLVVLSQVTDQELLCSTIVKAIGLEESTQLPILDQLLISLKESDLLLVLDNCDHIAESCASLCSTVLATCPAVTILATSRKGLGIEGEKTFQIASLQTLGTD